MKIHGVIYCSRLQGPNFPHMNVSSKYQIGPGLKFLKRVKLARFGQSQGTLHCEIVILVIKRVKVLWSCFVSHVQQLER